MQYVGKAQLPLYLIFDPIKEGSPSAGADLQEGSHLAFIPIISSTWSFVALSTQLIFSNSLLQSFFYLLLKLLVIFICKVVISFIIDLVFYAMHQCKFNFAAFCFKGLIKRLLSILMLYLEIFWCKFKAIWKMIHLWNFSFESNFIILLFCFPKLPEIARLNPAPEDDVSIPLYALHNGVWLESLEESKQGELRSKIWNLYQMTGRLVRVLIFYTFMHICQLFPFCISSHPPTASLFPCFRHVEILPGLWKALLDIKGQDELKVCFGSDATEKISIPSLASL